MGDHFGEEVIVRAWGGVYLLRRVWAAHPWAIEIMGEAQLEARASGRAATTPIPFPREDVFLATPEAVTALRSGKELNLRDLRRFPAR